MSAANEGSSLVCWQGGDQGNNNVQSVQQCVHGGTAAGEQDGAQHCALGHTQHPVIVCHVQAALLAAPLGQFPIPNVLHDSNTLASHRESCLLALAAPCLGHGTCGSNMIMLHAVLARAVLCKFFREEITEHSIYGSEVRANATVITRLANLQDITHATANHRSCLPCLHL